MARRSIKTKPWGSSLRLMIPAGTPTLSPLPSLSQPLPVLAADLPQRRSRGAGRPRSKLGQQPPAMALQRRPEASWPNHVFILEVAP
jgi:hypothetical protein